jgi:hypothetical protein
MQARGLEFVADRITRVFGILDIYLTEIVAMTSTCGYRVGNCAEEFPFPGGAIYLRADTVTAALFVIDESRLPSQGKHETLHAAAHALLQTAGYVSGLGREAYREFVDDEHNAIMIFSVEGGGCDILIREPAKLITWLRRARAIVHGCKNQCQLGCNWCLFVSNWQCPEFNRQMNRNQLAQLWREQFIIGDISDQHNRQT